MIQLVAVKQSAVSAFHRGIISCVKTREWDDHRFRMNTAELDFAIGGDSGSSVPFVQRLSLSFKISLSTTHKETTSGIFTVKFQTQRLQFDI